MSYQVDFTESGHEMFGEIADQKLRRRILKKIKRLEEAPAQIGELLFNELAGDFKLKVDRYRVLYQIDEENQKVSIYGIGIRREGERSDIYARVKRMFGLD